MKSLSILLLLLLTWNSGNSQNTFEFRWPMANHQVVMDMVEQDDRLILLLGENDFTDLFSTRIMTINANGDTLSTYLSLQDTGVLGYKILPLQNGSFVVAASNYLVDTTNVSAFYCLYFYNHNLQLIKNVCVNVPSKYVNVDIRGIKQYESNFLIYGSAFSQFNMATAEDLFVSIVDSNGAIINHRYFDSYVGPEIGYWCEVDSVNNQYSIIASGFTFNSSLQYVKVGFDFNIVEIIDLPISFEPPAQLYIKSPNDIVITNAYRNIASLNPDTRVNIALFDSTLQLKGNMYWDSVESYDPPAWFKSLAVLGDGSYAVGGTIQIWFHNKPSWFVLGRATEGMLGMWERYYGGDYYYNMCNMIRTSDGGYAMGGFYSDTLNPQDQGIYILKVNADGLLNGMSGSEAFNHSVIVWYDPADRRLILRTALPEALNLRIMDVTGRLVYERAGFRGDQQLHLPDLTSGAYLYEVTDPAHHQKAGKFLIQ